MISAAEAQQLLHQGRLAEAERAFAVILQNDPDNVQALNMMALVALRSQNLAIALAHIEHAVRRDADNPLTLHNHGRILAAAGRYSAAAAAQMAALRQAPNLHAARLYLGQALELAGQPHRALMAYARALQDAQQDGRWLNDDTTPAGFRPLVGHAVSYVRRGRHAALDDLLRPVIARFGSDSLKRVDKSLRIYFNQEPAGGTDPRQHATFFHFPDIPAQPYLDVALFPWVAPLQNLTNDIRDELVALLPEDQGREPVFGSAALEAAHMRGLEHPPSWNGYYFYRHGERKTGNCERCPRTAAALETLPLCRVPKHGPEVLFSVFTPGTHLLPHRGVTNTRLVAHLPLIVSGDCALLVGGEEHRWQEGHIVVFDDTYEHEAWNRGDSTRVVLIFDVWSPYLSEAERAALSLVIDDIGEFRQAVEGID